MNNNFNHNDDFCDDNKRSQFPKRPIFCIGPTGPTGPTGPAGGPTGPTGPTDTYDYFFNKTNHNYPSTFSF